MRSFYAVDASTIEIPKKIQPKLDESNKVPIVWYDVRPNNAKN